MTVHRRDFITLLGGAAAWPVTARAQQPTRMRRIGVLSTLRLDDPLTQTRIGAFLQGLQQFGWAIQQNLQVEYRWASGGDQVRRSAQELLALAPDAILANGAIAIAPLQQLTTTVPIVFVGVVDPVGAGYVRSLARPGGNITGFTNFEYSLSAKWPELVKQIAPAVTRAAVLRDPSVATGSGQFGVVQAIGSLLGLEVSPIDPREGSEIESAVAAFASHANGSLVITPTAFATIYREQIIALAAKYRLPAIYPFRYFVSDGGLISYGPDIFDQYRRAAEYVSRILKGDKPGDLPVQNPTKYELAVNLKTAKALGLDVPPTLLALADEVIE
jgi:putative ABC transport system substrate-binding protein